MDFFPQPPPQPMDSDRINAAFDNMGDDVYTNNDMNGYHGRFKRWCCSLDARIWSAFAS